MIENVTCLGESRSLICHDEEYLSPPTHPHAGQGRVSRGDGAHTSLLLP